MIWGDDWTYTACQKGGAGRFCTTLPPPRTVLPVDVAFRVLQGSKNPEKPGQEWLDLVETRWTIEEAALRLADAWIPCLYNKETLVATCILRFVEDVWILETLHAKKGWGTALIRAVIPWLYDRAGPFIMAYTWELSLPQLLAAWWRGWLRSAAEIQYGWAFNTEGCGFCPGGWEPIGPRPAMPIEIDGAIVSDSGLVDGWGHVLRFHGVPDWTAVAKKGGWKRLWKRSCISPGPGWSWTGEFVVVGLLNYNSGPVVLDWITAEI